MSKVCMEWLLSILIGLVAPFSVLSAVNRPGELPTEPTESVEESYGVNRMEIPVLLQSGEVKMMELDSYLIGVVLAEMPASFEMEALKAQAVVARTYTMKRMQSGDKHTCGAVCTKPACCQAYCSPAEYINKGNRQEDLKRVEDAVMSTSGKVLLYQGSYIEATYFSCSGGKTENALAVWGADIPYLQAVDSPGEEDASYYTDTVCLSVDDFLQKLGLSESKLLSIGKVTYTDGSGVDTIEISGTVFRGTEVRQKLGLRSTAFTVHILGDSVSITTKGYGHRVGMSQYGAQAMAQSGKKYPEILQYYYNGTDLGIIPGN